MLFFIFPILFPVMIIGLSLTIIKLRKGRIDASTLTLAKGLLGAFIAASAWFCLFDDKQTILECRKDAMVCSYYRSTVANPELRLVRSFSIKNLQNIELKTETRRSGKYSRKNVYRIVFVTPAAREQFPITFDIREWAIGEIGKINHFLKSNREIYVYKSGRAELNEFEQGQIAASILMTLALIVWCVIDRRKKKTKAL